jgi:hypothetical protein
MNYDQALEFLFENGALPTRWDQRKLIGVCASLSCSRSSQGLVPAEGGELAHDCPCCSEHCVCAEIETMRVRRMMR